MNLQDTAAGRDRALQALAGTEAGRPVLLLHSGRFEPRWARRSLMGWPVAWFTYDAVGGSRLEPVGGMEGRLEWTVLAGVGLTGEPWADLRMLLHHPDLPGRWVGWLSYDLGRLIEPDRLARPPVSDWPLIELGYCPHLQSFPAPRGEPVPPPPARHPGRSGRLPLDADFTRQGYLEAVRRVIDHIAAGDVFQVNLAQRFCTIYTGLPRRLYQNLAAVSPAWYGAYLELGRFDRPAARTDQPAAPALPQRVLCSTSPELFLQVTGRHVVTRPIKGTRPRPAGSTPGTDEQAMALMASAKDAAELAMIVDLMRNDLGRVCAFGSVRVTQQRVLEAHPTVYHTTATVEADLAGSADVVDLLTAVLPGGSVTGAPKVRAMQIIDRLEPVPRGPYCGCIGYLGRDEAQLNIAIRTMLLRRTEPADRPTAPRWQVSFSAGGGIVADSDPQAEYQETLDKAEAMLQALDLAGS